MVLSVAAAVGVSTAGPAQAVQYPQATIVSADPQNNTPNVLNGAVKAIVQVGNKIVLGGTFTSVQESGSNKPIQTRTRLLAFDATTGVVDPAFAPVLDGEVSSLAVSADGQSVYVGGYFNNLNGVATKKLTRINLADGTKTAGFKPAVPNSNVRDLRLMANGQLIVAGGFSKLGAVLTSQIGSLNAATGAVTPFLSGLAFAGPLNGGVLTVNKIDVSGDGSKLLGLGNFSTINGAPRSQLFLLDTSGPAAVLSSWQTGFFAPGCAGVFDTYMRDLDISPDGSYAVVTTTGAYGGPSSPCDTQSRWDLTTNASGLMPVWTNVTGGDTTYAVAVTNAAVYVGGHFRWINNPYAGDAAGPGAVPRQGIAALDPANGLPLSWNPGRDRGVGVFDFLASSTGLWVGNDTKKIGGETHQRIAFFPLAGGVTPPANATASLPGTAVLLGRPGAGSDASVLYRVNAAGSALASADDGPDWTADDQAANAFRNSGSNSAYWGGGETADSTVPNTALDRAPLALFDSERWDPGTAGDGNEMQWQFPVAAGTHVSVRLYLIDRCGCTSVAGSRVFTVGIDGNPVAPNLDVNAIAGHNVGTMRSFDVTSDGSVDIDFRHLVENPLINGIEIINKDVPAGTGGPGTADEVRTVGYDGSSAPSAPVTLAGTESWSQARGAFAVDGVVYNGWADGTMTARAFDGSTFGPKSALDLHGSGFISELPNVTGIVYQNSRIYYTLFGNSNLYSRAFTSESRVVGELRSTVGGASALNPAGVAGMFLSGSTLYAADKTDGHLYAVPFTGGLVGGSATTVDSTVDWRSHGTFLR